MLQIFGRFSFSLPPDCDEIKHFNHNNDGGDGNKYRTYLATDFRGLSSVSILRRFSNRYPDALD